MRRSLCILLCLLLQLMSVHAENYVVLSGADNTIIEKENKDEKQSMASISKIMTAVIAIEHEQLNESPTADDEVSKAYGSSVYLKQGQQITMRDLLYGPVLGSGNDAAAEIAEHVAGSQGAFVELMNHKATEIGMSNTTFSNPNGLDEENGGNISAANDVATLMSYTIKDKGFRTVTGNKYYTADRNMCWKNKNRLLFDYLFIVSGKAGFTKKAGQTLVSAAEHGDVEGIVVTLRGGDDFAFHGQRHTKVSQKMDAVTTMRRGDYTIGGRKLHVPEMLRVTLHKGGSDKLRVRIHCGHKGFVVKVQKNDDISVYSLASKEVRGEGLFS